MLRIILSVALVAESLFSLQAEQRGIDSEGFDARAQLTCLLSESRDQRIQARTALAKWAEKHTSEAKLLFLQELSVSKEPEIRERCLQFLKPIAAKEYGNFGEGYMGISMGDAVMIQIPGEAQARNGMIISFISKDSPAEKAKLQQGDVIVSLNKKLLMGGENAIEKPRALSEKIRAVGAGKVAHLEIWRKNELLHVDVLLTRRPATIDQLELQLMPNGGMRINEDELKQAVELEKHSNEYFSEWLEKQLAAEPAK
jgi:predicted metalloprotease with PDZ domain